MKYIARQSEFSLVSLDAMGFILPDQGEHINRVPFKGVLTRLDEPSNRPPNGSNGRLVMITTEVAKVALPTLIGMAVDVTNDLGDHDAKKKIGIISDADIIGKDLVVSGYLYGSDFPKEVERIKREKDLLGMSYELKRVWIEDVNAQVWVPKSLVFTGAAILYKDSAAYQNTSFAASKDKDVINASVPGNVSTQKADPSTEWSAPALKDFSDKSWEELSDSERRHIAGHFAWSVNMPPKVYGDLKLPHHDPGTGKVNKRGVDNAMARLNQTQGIGDKSAVEAHLRAHQKAFGEGEDKEAKASVDKEKRMKIEEILAQVDAIRTDLTKVLKPEDEVKLEATHEEVKVDKLEVDATHEEEPKEKTAEEPKVEAAVEPVMEKAPMAKGKGKKQFMKIMKAMIDAMIDDDDDMKEGEEPKEGEETDDEDVRMFRKMLHKASASADTERLDKIEKAIEAAVGLITDVAETVKGLVTDRAEKHEGLATDDAKVAAKTEVKPEDVTAERRTFSASTAEKFLAKHGVDPKKEYTIPELDNVLKAAGVQDVTTRMAIKMQLQDMKLLK